MLSKVKASSQGIASSIVKITLDCDPHFTSLNNKTYTDGCIKSHVVVDTLISQSPSIVDKAVES